MYTKEIYKKYIPVYFFVEFQTKYQTEFEAEKLINLIKDFDSPRFSNVFIIWNTELRREIHQRIINNCDKIVNSYAQNEIDFNFDLDEQEIHK